MKTRMSEIRKTSGFTLIELMIVVAIIGILAAVAIPQYQSYTRNATASAALSEVKAYQTAVGICAQTNLITACVPGNTTPNANGVPNLQGKITASAAAADGLTLTVTPGGAFGSTQTILLKSDSSGGDWVMSCKKGADTEPNLCGTSAVAGNPAYNSKTDGSF